MLAHGHIIDLFNMIIVQSCSEINYIELRMFCFILLLLLSVF